jgi:hypothetical protein
VSVPSAHATTICRSAGVPIPSRSFSRRLFVGLFKLLFERGKLGERGIRIRLLVAPSGAASERLCVILFTFGPIDTFAAFAPRSVAAGGVTLPFRALTLALHPLLAIMPLLPLLPAGTFATIMARAARTLRRLSGVGSSRCGTIGRRGRRDGGSVGGGSLRLLRTWAAGPVWSTLGSASRTPNFDERRFFS